MKKILSTLIIVSLLFVPVYAGDRYKSAGKANASTLHEFESSNKVNNPRPINIDKYEAMKDIEYIPTGLRYTDENGNRVEWNAETSETKIIK